MGTLSELKKGQQAVIRGIAEDCPSLVRQRLMDLGFVSGTAIAIENISPLGNPVAYLIHRSQISLRREDAHYILIEYKS